MIRRSESKAEWNLELGAKNEIERSSCRCISGRKKTVMRSGCLKRSTKRKRQTKVFRQRLDAKRQKTRELDRAKHIPLHTVRGLGFGKTIFLERELVLNQALRLDALEGSQRQSCGKKPKRKLPWLGCGALQTLEMTLVPRRWRTDRGGRQRGMPTVIPFQNSKSELGFKENFAKKT